MSKGKDTSLVKVAFGVLLAKAIVKTLHGLRRLAWRWRRVLTPFWAGFAVWLFAVLYRWHWSAWWPLVLVVPAIGTAATVAGPKLGDRWRVVVMKLVPEGLDRGRDGVLDRPAERAYLGALCAWVGTYLALRIGDGPSELSAGIWQSGVLVLGGLWWWHRRIRVAGKADRYAKRWGKISRGEVRSIELRALQGSKVVKVVSMGSIAKLRVRLADSITPDQVARCCPSLASYMPKMRPNSVFFAPDEHSAKHVWFTFIPADPWKGKVDHPSPEIGSTTLRESGFRFPMGIHADATDLVYQLQHTLLVGRSGSGKSIWIHSLLRWLVGFQDVVLLGIDMAGGATLGAWRKVLALPLATDVDEARHVLERVLAVIEYRERELGRMSEESDDADDEFIPSPETPWVVLVIDEFPDLIAADASDTSAAVRKPVPIPVLIGRIGKRARKCGVRVIVAAQNGSKADVGSKEFQAQLKATVGLGLDPHASKVLWGELIKQGWNSTGLVDGQFLLRDQDHSRPEIAKGFYVGTRERRAAVSRAMELGRPVLEPLAWDRLMGTGTDSEHIVIESLEPETEELEVVLRTIRDEYPEGVKADALEGLPGMPARATIFRRLNAARERGQARSVDGVWHFIPPEQRESRELTIR